MKITKNPGTIKFVGVITQSDRAPNAWAWVEFPYDLKELYGVGNLIPALIKYDGIEYRGRITKMGAPHPVLLVKRDVLTKLGKQKGDTVAVSVSLDDKPREVLVPKELNAALNKYPGAMQAYKKLSYSHRKEYAEWISSAKQAITKERRAAKAAERVVSKR